MSDGALRQVFRAHLVGFDILAVETGSTSSGVPDMNYAKNEVEGWIEMKKADHWRCTIRPMQVSWCERRLRHNSRVFCAVRRAVDELWFYHASQMRWLKNDRLDNVEHLGMWKGGPGRWDWAAIQNLMMELRSYSSSVSSSNSSLVPSRSR